MRRPGGPAADYFVYGTLVDADVRTRVLGHPIRRGRVRPAVIEGWRRVTVAGASYPGLVPESGRRVDGLLLTGVTAAEEARLIRFEGGEYEIVDVTVRAAGRDVAARMFVTRPGVAVTDDEWTLESWRRRHRRDFLRLAGRRTGG